MIENNMPNMQFRADIRFYFEAIESMLNMGTSMQKITIKAMLFFLWSEADFEDQIYFS